MFEDINSKTFVLCTVLLTCLICTAGSATAAEGDVTVIDQSPPTADDLIANQQYEFEPVIEYSLPENEHGEIMIIKDRLDNGRIGGDSIKYIDIVGESEDETISPVLETTAPESGFIQFGVVLYSEDEEYHVADTTSESWTVRDQPDDHPPEAEIECSSSHVVVGEEIECTGERSDDDNGITSFEFDFNGRSVGVTGDEAAERLNERDYQHTFDEPGTYSVELTVEDKRGQRDTAETSIAVNAVNTPPEARVECSPTELTAGERVVCSGAESTDDTNIVEYEWEIGHREIVLAGEDVSFDYADLKDDPGTYDVELTVEDEQGETDTAETSFTIMPENQPPEAEVECSPTEVTVGEEFECSGEESTDDTGIVDYEWQVGDNRMRGEETIKGQFGESENDIEGVYEVELTVEDEHGETDTAQSSITVVPENRPPEAKIECSPTEVTVGEEFECSGEESTDDTGIAEYRWWFDTQTKSGKYLDNVEHSFDDPGGYTVKLGVKDEHHHVNVAETTIEVNPEPDKVPSPEVDITTPTTRVPEINQQITLDASPSTDDDRIVEYMWLIDDRTRTEGKLIRHEFEKPGKHIIKLTVRDSSGKENSVTREITVGDDISVDVDCSVIGSKTVECSAESLNSGKINKFDWEISDKQAEEITGKEISYTFEDTHLTSITVTAIGVYGTSDKASQTITFSTAPTPRFDHSPATVFVGETVAFDASGSLDKDGHITEYNWNIGTPTIAEKSGEVITHTFNQSGKHTVELVVTDDSGKTAKKSQPLSVQSPAFTSMSIRREPDKPNEPAQLTVSSTSQLGTRPIRIQLYVSTPDEVTITDYNLPPDWSTSSSATAVSNRPLSGGESTDIQMDLVATANGTYEITGEVVYLIGEDQRKVGPMPLEPVELCVSCNQTSVEGPGFGIPSVIGSGLLFVIATFMRIYRK